MSRSVIIILIVIAVFPAYKAFGTEGALKINPGMYKITGTTTTNLDAEPHVKTTEACIPESEIKPEAVLPDRDACSISNLKSKGNKASFEFTCKSPDSGPTLKGKAEYSTGSDSFKYKFDLNGSYGGKDLIVNSEGGGERTGDCK